MLNDNPSNIGGSGIGSPLLGGTRLHECFVLALTDTNWNGVGGKEKKGARNGPKKLVGSKVL